MMFINGFGLADYWPSSPARTPSLENERMDLQRYHHTTRSRNNHKFPYPQYRAFYDQVHPVQETLQ